MRTIARCLSGGAAIVVGLSGLAACGAREAPLRATEAKRQENVACSFSAGGSVLTPLSRSSSTVALAKSGRQTLAFVADEDARRLLVIDVDRGTELAFAELGAAPGSVLVSAAGRVAVTLPGRSEVQILTYDAGKLASACSVATAPEPVALAVTPDSRTLLVSSAWGHALAAYGTASLDEQYRLDLPRDPRAVVVSADGTRAFVSHAVGGALSTVDLVGRRVQRVSLDAPPSRDAAERVRMFRTQMEPLLLAAKGEEKVAMQASYDEQLKLMRAPERVANQGLSLVLFDRQERVLVPQIEVDPGQNGTRSTGYGSGAQTSAAPSVAVLDAATGRLRPQSIPAIAPWRLAGVTSPISESCVLPRSAALDEEHGTLLVTCLGTDTLAGYDASAPSPIDAELLRVRVASGPTGVAVDAAERRAVVWSQFERALNVLPLPHSTAALPAKDPPVRRIALAAVPGASLPSDIALGRRLFHAAGDPRISRDGRACASCHVNGRDDGLVWSTPGGPRRTKSLAGSIVGTAPYSWDGAAASVHAQLDSTIERLDGQGGLRAVELDALVAYVSSLPAPPRDAPMDATVERGAALFASAETGCASCHGGEHKSDSARHGVSSDTAADTTAHFDTPSLSFLSGRAPYFHDGRYATLRDVLTAKGDAMGHTSHLSEGDLGALEAFLRTL